MYSARLTKIVEEFQLENILPEVDISNRVITRKEVNRPALQLTGFYHRFDNDRLQIIGRVEHSYLQTLDERTREEAICHLFECHIPCLMICKNLEIFPEMLFYGRKHDVPIFRTCKTTTDFAAEMIMWLRGELADRVTMHGVLVDIYGEGVLITGASGIGKSETALELIKRGHRLIADDAVEIKKIADQTLVGTCPELIQYLIELRGIGIINVKELFGIGAVKQQKSIDLVIKLENWDGNQCSYDRLGLNDEYIEIIGNKVICNTIPIRPGRNVAVICESAAISNRQKKMGNNTAMELEKKILQNNFTETK
ncbi:MAG: HPr(Ser) kinase/phosphatase [Anaerotignum sp.]|nr:HPr(Ser) kinase/phosphatase [Anaerotignum sp.]